MQDESLNSAPKISVVIPTRHRNDLLARCLERLTNGYQKNMPVPFEVIVTDDGSDSTAQQMIAERFPEVRWFAGPKRGPGSNRNSGVTHVRGEWIAFTDDDCVPSDHWLSDLWKAAQAAGDKPVVLEGKTTCEEGVHSIWEQAPVNTVGGYLWSCNMMLRKETFGIIGGFDEEFPYPHLEDVDLRERIMGLGIPVVWVPDAVIDHPARPVTERSLLQGHESEFMFWYKAGNTTAWMPQHLKRLFVCRLRTFVYSKDNLQARARLLACLASEATHVLQNGKNWETKYRTRYSDRPQIAYSDDMKKRMLWV